MQEKTLWLPSVCLGCDPEAFFTRKGVVIGAERVIPKEGLSVNYGGKVVIDGVQAELHVPPTGCRQSMAAYLQAGFIAIHRRLQELGDPDVQLSFQSHYEVAQEELDALSPECKILGCQPSLNHYGFEGLGVDVETFTHRSAGGHLHFGLCPYLQPRAAECVPVLDAIVGNFCVMVDRDPYAAERRKVYGRAGEYRLPKHGLEYRSLSNFWLRSYVLQSMVMGLARWALGVCYTSELYRQHPTSPIYWDAAHRLLTDYMDPRQVQRAINQNDLTLAKENWAGFQKFYTECVDVTGLNSGRAGGFYEPDFSRINHFLRQIEEVGLEYWFKQNPFTHWLTLRTGAELKTLGPSEPLNGWETFLSTTVEQDRRALKKAA